MKYLEISGKHSWDDICSKKGSRNGVTTLQRGASMVILIEAPANKKICKNYLFFA
jgi:hypothetical protein